MNEQYIRDLYQQLVSVDPSFANDVSFDKFVNSVKDPSYASSLYSQLNQIDNTFKNDVSLDSFLGAVGAVKKKDATAISAGSTSASTSPQVSSSVSSSSQSTQPSPELQQQQSPYPDVTGSSMIDVSIDGGPLRQKQKVITTSQEDRRKWSTPMETPNIFSSFKKTVEGPIQAEEPKPIETSQQKKEKISFIDPLINSLDSDFVQLDEEAAVPKLQYLFGPLGFKFEESGLGDYVTVTAPDNTTKTTIPLDPFFGMGAAKNSEALKNFVRTNAQEIPKEKLDRISNQYVNENKKYATEQEYDNDIKYINDESNKIITEEASISKEYAKLNAERDAINAVPQSQRNNPQYIEKARDLQLRLNALQERVDFIDESKRKLNTSPLMRATGQYAEMKSKQGDPIGAFANNILNGFGRELSSMVSNYIQGVAEAQPNWYLFDKSSRNRDMAFKIAQEKGLKPIESGQEFMNWFNSLPSDAQKEISGTVRDKEIKSVKYGDEFGGGVTEKIRPVITNLFGDKSVTQEYIKDVERNNFVGGAVLGAAQSIPAMIGPKYMRIAGMFLQGSDFIDEEIQNNPESKNLTEREKAAIKTVIGVPVALLEDYGFRNLIGNSSVVSNLIFRALGKGGAGITGKTFAEFVRNDIESGLLRAGLTAAGGAAAEFETGLFQQAWENTVKAVYNEVNSKVMNNPEQRKIFNSPDFWSRDMLMDVFKGGAQEAIGGLVLGVPGSISAGMRSQGFKGISDSQFKVFEEMANDDNILNAWISSLKAKVANGDLKPAEAKEQLNDYRNAVGLYRQLPDNLTTQQKKDAMNLIRERNVIQQQIENKDPQLTTKQRNRINQINEQLKVLPENAIQEPEAEGGMLRPEQPEVGLQEVGKGDTQGKEAPSPTTQEQVIITDEDKARRQSLTDALFIAEELGDDKVMVGDTEMSLQDAKQELADLTLKEEKSKQAPAPAPTAAEQTTDIERRKQENDKKYEDTIERHRRELAELNKKEGKSYADLYDILTINEYSKDQSPRSQEAIDLANRQEKEFNDLLKEKRSIEDDASKIKYSNNKELPILKSTTTETAPTAPIAEQVAPAAKLTNDIENKKADIERRRQEELDTNTSAGYGVIASDYLFTVGRGSMLSTDYLLQALTASFPFAGKQIDAIRNKYASKLGNILDDVNSKSYSDAIAEIRNAINTTYQNSEIELLFDEILNNSTGFVSREGNRVSSRLEALNDEHQQKINAKYDAEIAALESTTTQAAPAVTATEQVAPEFQLESKTSAAKQKMIDEATRLMEEQERKGFSEKAFDATNPEPIAKPITIVVKENSPLAAKVKRMGLSELIGKKINLVMADQLKVGTVSIGKKMLNRMGGPFFPLIDALFGKVAWASVSPTAAMSIVNGAVKSDYTVVYNMNPSAIDSNSALRETFIETIKLMPKADRDLIISQIIEQLTGKKFGAKTDVVQAALPNIKNFEQFEKFMSGLDLDTKAAIIQNILPSRDINAGTAIGKTLQDKGITIESLREQNIEQFVADLPAGALTMVLEVHDKSGKKVTNATKAEAIMTREQQEAENLPTHDNYPIYIRGKAIGLLEETLPFWQVLKDSMNNINVKVANIVKKAGGRSVTALEARANEMRSASMSASAAKKVTGTLVSEYEKFISLLSRSFPTVEVVTSQEKFDSLLKDLNAKQLVTKNQKIYGAVVDGKIYLNPALENYNTPIHEFGHIWTNIVEQIKPELFNKGMSLIANSNYVSMVINNKDYARIIKSMRNSGVSEKEIQDYINKEALATAIGDQGEAFVTAAQKKDFKNWLNKLYSLVKNLTGISKYTAEQIENITLEEFLKAVSVDLLSGTELFTNLQAEKLSEQLQLSTENQTPDDIVKRGRASGVSEEAIRKVLENKGIETADIDKALGKVAPAGTKVELSEETLPGYNKLVNRINGIIERGRKKGYSDQKIRDNVVKNVQANDPAYAAATNVQQEQIIRDIDKQLGQKQKSAPSKEKVLGKEKKMVLVDDMKSLKEQIRITAKIARDIQKAREDIAKMISSWETSGKITTSQAQTIINKLSKLDVGNQEKVDRFIQYMENVFNDAEYAQKISNIKNKLSTAKKNIKTKIGEDIGLIASLQELFAINPELIPIELLDAYTELVNMMGANQKILPLADIKDVKNSVNNILDKINEQQSRVYELADSFDSYEDKVTDDNDKIDFSATINKMLKEGVITDEDAALMRKYKSDIMPREVKDKATEEEIEAERQAIIKELLNNTTLDGSNLPSRDSRDKANIIKKLLTDKILQRLSINDLKQLQKIIDNINNGYFTNSAQLIMEKMNSIKNAYSLFNSIMRAVPLPITRLAARFKSIFTKKTSLEEMARRGPAFYIDQQFGDFKTKNIFDALFSAAAAAESLFKSDTDRISRRLDKIRNKINQSFPAKYRNSPNALLMSSYKMMTYMIQKEYLSNPGNKQVNPAHKFLEKTIAHLEEQGRTSELNEAEMLREILTKYSTDGQIDLDKLDKSFTQAERDGINEIRKINDELTDKAIHTATVIRGMKIDPLSNYIHLSVIDQYEPSSSKSATEASNNFNKSLNPGTRGKALIERTGTVSALNFDIFSSVSNGSRSVLLDYYMTEPIRTARKTLNQTRKMLNESGKANKEKNNTFTAIKDAFNLAAENLLVNSYASNSFIDDVTDFIAKQGYRATLASVPRFFGELKSNVAMALIFAPKEFAKGLSYAKVMSSEKGIEIAKVLNMKQIGRLYAADALSGKLIDKGIISERQGVRGAKPKGTIANISTQIYNSSLKKVSNSIELIADTLISTPDMMVMRPVWFGSFSAKFKELTGNEVDFDKIASNDEAYMNENKDAIDAATETADMNSVFVGGAKGSFIGMLRNAPKPNEGTLTKFYNTFNNYMITFQIYDYIATRTAVMAMVGKGQISRTKGAQLLAAITTRSIVYIVVTKMLSDAMIRLFMGGDDEEDDKSVLQKIGQAMASAFTSLFFGRDFGNIARIFINYGADFVNEEFLTDLREGEYDYEKDNIGYSPLSKARHKEGEATVLDFITSMAGQYGPALNTTNLIVKKVFDKEKKEPDAIARDEAEKYVRIPLEILGNLGYMPLYKDVRKVIMDDIYKDLRQDKIEKERKAKTKAAIEPPIPAPFKTWSEVERNEPQLYKKLMGPGSPGYKEREALKKAEREEREAKEAARDIQLGYQPKPKGGSGRSSGGSSGGWSSGYKSPRKESKRGGWKSGRD